MREEKGEGEQGGIWWGEGEAERGKWGGEWERHPRRRGRGALILPLVSEGEAVRGDRAPVATGSVEQGRRPGVRLAGWSGWAKA